MIDYATANQLRTIETLHKALDMVPRPYVPLTISKHDASALITDLEDKAVKNFISVNLNGRTITIKSTIREI